MLAPHAAKGKEEEEEEEREEEEEEEEEEEDEAVNEEISERDRATLVRGMQRLGDWTDL